MVAAFAGGTMTSDAGALLLGATDRALGLIDRFAACFVDHRDRSLTRPLRRPQLGPHHARQPAPAAVAHVLLCALRRIGLAQTRFARATCGSIRLKLLKIAALVRIGVRRIKVAMASGCPYRREFQAAHARLSAAAA